MCTPSIEKQALPLLLDEQELLLPARSSAHRCFGSEIGPLAKLRPCHRNYSESAGSRAENLIRFVLHYRLTKAKGSARGARPS
jgi:hypothetical protein